MHGGDKLRRAVQPGVERQRTMWRTGAAVAPWIDFVPCGNIDWFFTFYSAMTPVTSTNDKRLADRIEQSLLCRTSFRGGRKLTSDFQSRASDHSEQEKTEETEHLRSLRLLRGLRTSSKSRFDENHGVHTGFRMVLG